MNYSTSYYLGHNTIIYGKKFSDSNYGFRSLRIITLYKSKNPVYILNFVSSSKINLIMT
ncbi:hypothetical protein CLLI_28380 [Clostridium liquoris]|uniref:Uncharacterized protein n=1 Tax=Clostridium liquoris TaxID=1289519 RepID=A0A2T0AZL0_9CLOT|nr:hypothetical protein CLLI_28380 [Clostridium liquoris]